MSEPLKGAIIGGLIYEKLATNEEEARNLAASGEILFDPCHHHSTVGPMAGVVTYSMPVWILQNKTFGNFAYCTLNEGLGKVLRFGAFSPEVIDRLNWMEKILAPVLKEAIEIKGKCRFKNYNSSNVFKWVMRDITEIKQELHCYLGNLHHILLKLIFQMTIKADVLTFIDKNDHFFLNISMPACKCSLDPLERYRIQYSSLCNVKEWY